MTRINCWEFMKCGREEGGERSDELGVCPAVTLADADGFLDERNAGRGCAYVAGTFCGGEPQGSYAEKRDSCYECKFYKLLKIDHGIDLSALHFFRFVKENLNKSSSRNSGGMDEDKPRRESGNHPF